MPTQARQIAEVLEGVEVEIIHVQDSDDEDIIITCPDGSILYLEGKDEDDKIVVTIGHAQDPR